MPGQWDLTTEQGGVKPPKANILDAWSAVDQGGADTFVYLAFARGGRGESRGSAGTTDLIFELNHDSRLWKNSNNATIPCRRTGDMLVSYEAQGNDVERGARAVDHLAGRLRDRVRHQRAPRPLTGLTPNVDVQGAVNGPAITNYLPGFYGGSIPIERFGEAALNLSQILDDALR